MSNKKDELKITITNKNEESNYKRAISSIQKQLNIYEPPFKSIIENYNKNILPILPNQTLKNQLNLATSALEGLKPIISNSVNQNTKLMSEIINSLNIGDFVTDYIKKYQNVIDTFIKAAGVLPKSRLLGMDSARLEKYYWVVPFEYDYAKLEKLEKYKTRFDFERNMIKYFNKNRIKRLFSKVKRQFKEKDKKELVKQIENSYNNGNYAICITSLMTLFDGSTMILLDSKSDNQHVSYKVIDTVLKYINSRPIDEYSYELYLKVDILNNFINKLYRNIINLKTSRRNLLLSRHLNAHGVRYLNNKINVLRLLNALYYCNMVIEELNLTEQFIKIKNNKNFMIVTNNSSN